MNVRTLNLTKPYAPTRDLDGRPIAELTTREIERRLAVLRDGDQHPISNQYRRAYEQVLATRGAVQA